MFALFIRATVNNDAVCCRDAVAVMAPGRFRRRLSDDHSDVLEPSAGSGSASGSRSGSGAGLGLGLGAGSAPRGWLSSQDGSGSTRARLPWLSPRETRHPLRDVRLSCFRR